MVLCYVLKLENRYAAKLSDFVLLISDKLQTADTGNSREIPSIRARNRLVENTQDKLVSIVLKYYGKFVMFLN